jgi:aryl-alcohol dehydrogenase-like predicted oxidoreductase
MYNASYLRRVEPLLNLLREIGDAYGGKTPAQVSLNWLICKGAVPIPGAKSAAQVEDNAGALGWRLKSEEIAKLDEMSAPLAA